MTSADPGPTALLLVSVFNASSDKSKPTPAVSIAVTKIVTSVNGSVIFQHEPHSAEPKPETACAPPTLGKVGKLPSVGYFGVSWEQATSFVLNELLS